MNQKLTNKTRKKLVSKAMIILHLKQKVLNRDAIISRMSARIQQLEFRNNKKAEVSDEKNLQEAKSTRETDKNTAGKS